LTSETRGKIVKESMFSVDLSWKGLIRLGGILLIVSGIGGTFLSPLLSARLYASGTPTDATGYLQLFSQHQLLANLDWSFWLFGDLLLIPVSIAIYLVLRRVNNSVALVGSILSIVYVLFDICVTELNSLTLVTLSQGYASAATDALRAPYIAAATYGVAALSTQTFFSFTIGAVGWLFWSLLMSKSFFGKGSAIFGVIVNVMGILGGVGAMVQGTPFYLLGVFTILGAIFTGIWFIIIGAQLYRYGSHLSVSG
jgi:Domain of unknown function (DUF4386)